MEKFMLICIHMEEKFKNSFILEYIKILNINFNINILISLSNDSSMELISVRKILNISSYALQEIYIHMRTVG
jgi:hypothetical protein